MFDAQKIKAEYKKLSESAGAMGDQGRRAKLFAAAFARDLGLRDPSGAIRTGPNGLPQLAKDAPIKPHEVDLRALTEAVLGPEWRDVLGLTGNGFEGGVGRRYLSEADAGAVGPSAMMNVAAWSGAVAGLYAATFIDAYNDQPAYKMRGLFPDRPAVLWQGGQRLIDIFGPYEPLPEVGPLQEAPSMKLDALYVSTAALKKYGGKIEIAKETAEVDISGGQFLAKAKLGAQAAALRENENAISIVTGQVNNFSLGFLNDTSATGYNTYGATITTPRGSYTLANDLTNPVVDLSAFTKSKEAVSNLLNPLTGYPIAVDFTTTLVPIRLEDLFTSIAYAPSAALLTQAVAPYQVAPGTFPNFSTNIDNPYRGVIGQVVSDQWLDFRHKLSATATDPNRPAGLGLSDANAYRWYRLNPQKFACKLVGWDIQSLDLSPTDYVMATRGIVAGQVVTVASTYQVLNPWYIQRNKVA